MKLHSLTQDKLQFVNSVVCSYLLPDVGVGVGATNHSGRTGSVAKLLGPERKL